MYKVTEVYITIQSEDRYIEVTCLTTDTEHGKDRAYEQQSNEKFTRTT